MDSLLLGLAGITEGSALADTLRERELILRLTAASRQGVLQPQEPGGLSPALRAALAARIATTNGESTLAAHYRAMLEDAAERTPEIVALCDPSAAPPADPPWTEAVIRHADLLTNRPQDSTSDSIERLRAAGVEDADIVRLTQLAGFLSHEVRFLAALRLLNGLGGR